MITEEITKKNLQISYGEKLFSGVAMLSLLIIQKDVVSLHFNAAILSVVVTKVRNSLAEMLVGIIVVTSKIE